MLWRRDHKEFFLIALRALSQIASGIQPPRRDVIILRRNTPAGDGDLPLDELCCRLIRRELGRDERIVEPAMTEDEMHKFKELAGRALYLGRLRDRRRITEAEYIGLLNLLREQHGH